MKNKNWVFLVVGIIFLIGFGVATTTITDSGTSTFGSDVDLGSNSLNASKINNVHYVDTVAELRSALSSSNEGDKIVLSSGTYDLGTTPLDINYTFTIEGSGFDTEIKYEGTDSALRNPTTTEVSGLVIKEIFINQSGTPYTGTGFNFNYIHHSALYNIYIFNFDKGIHFPAGNTFYNSVFNPFINESNTGIQMDSNQNNIYGGRNYLRNLNTAIGINITGEGNNVNGFSAERIAGSENGTGFWVDDSYNTLASCWAEGLNDAINMTSSSSYNLVFGLRSSQNYNNLGTGNTILGGNQDREITADTWIGALNGTDSITAFNDFDTTLITGDYKLGGGTIITGDANGNVYINGANTGATNDDVYFNLAGGNIKIDYSGNDVEFNGNTLNELGTANWVTNTTNMATAGNIYYGAGPEGTKHYGCNATACYGLY